MTTSTPSRRDRLRAEQEARAAAARRRRVIGVGAGVMAVLVVVAVVAWVVVSHSRQSSTGQAVDPPHGQSSTGAIRVTGTATSGAPTVVVYQDYQCPYCKLAETAVGPALNELAASGDVVLEYRTLTFLDSGTNTSSYRAAMAAAAADVVGHYRQYHDTVFANQPATEGTGYTDTQLRVDFARQAGISGPDLERFQRLYDTKATSDFVHSADARSQKDLAGLIGKPSTPTFTLDGKVWEGWEPWVNRDAVASAADLLKVIKADAHK